MSDKVTASRETDKCQRQSRAAHGGSRATGLGSYRNHRRHDPHYSSHLRAPVRRTHARNDRALHHPHLSDLATQQTISVPIGHFAFRNPAARISSISRARSAPDCGCHRCPLRISIGCVSLTRSPKLDDGRNIAPLIPVRRTSSAVPVEDQGT